MGKIVGDWDTPPTQAELAAGGWDTPPTPEEMGRPKEQRAAPNVGAGETFVNKAVSAIPLGKQITQLGATGVLQLAKALGAGKSGVRLGPAALAAGMKQDETSTIPGAGDTYRNVKHDFQERTEAGSEQNPWASTAGTATGLGLSMAAPLPIAKIGKGLSGAIASGVLNGAGYGAAAGLNDSDLTNPSQTMQRTAMGGGIGAALGVPIGLVGGAASKLGQMARNKVASIDETVARKAEELAAAETASARSLAGRTAQDAYKQLEHLRELGAMRALGPEEAQVAAQLEQELAAKAQEKLLPAVAQKEAAAQAYSQALQTNGERASEIAANKLSGAEFKRQLMPRVLRYGLPALGGMVGHQLGGGYGAGAGALVGAGLRPMMHSLLRMSSQPVVQRPLFNALSKIADPLTENAIAPATTMAERGMGDLLPAFADDDRKRQSVLAALRREQK